MIDENGEEITALEFIKAIEDNMHNEPQHRVKCVGSPHGDFYHEIESGWLIPCAMSLQHPSLKEWESYNIINGVGIYTGVYIPDVLP